MSMSNAERERRWRRRQKEYQKKQKGFFKLVMDNISGRAWHLLKNRQSRLFKLLLPLMEEQWKIMEAEDAECTKAVVARLKKLRIT